MYEDVTVDSQPSVHRHLDREWPVHFDDGRGMWWDDSTALKSGDWYEFRDPGQMWERPYYQAGTAHEQLIEGAVRTAKRERAFDDFTPEWVEFLRANLQVPAFAEHGIWLALASAARDTLSDTITHCVALEAAMKQRQAQAYLLYGMDLEEHFGEFPVERSTRELAERRGVAARPPLRREAARDAGLGRARLRGQRLLRDDVRPVDQARAADALGALQRRHRSPRRSATSPSSSGSGCATGPPSWCGSRSRTKSTASANRAVLTGWLEEWMPLAEEAALGVQPVFDALPAGISFDDARTNVQIDVDELLGRVRPGGAAPAAGGAA